jgi:hypothetical protein
LRTCKACSGKGCRECSFTGGVGETEKEKLGVGLLAEKRRLEREIMALDQFNDYWQRTGCRFRGRRPGS